MRQSKEVIPRIYKISKLMFSLPNRKIIFAAFAAAGSARAQNITRAEKDKAVAVLKNSKKGVLQATKGLSETQWNFQAAPGKWSIAECLEHIAGAEDFIPGLDKNSVMKVPAAPDRDTARIDAGVLGHVPDRSVKAQAPEPIKPANRYGSPEASIKHFVENRDHRSVRQEHSRSARPRQ
jgi:hypothetical protein